MSSATQMQTPPSRAKARFLLQSVVMLLAVTACCMFAGLIADRFPAHVDVTSTRAHRLSARTMDILGKLRGEYELVVTVNSALVDAASARRTQDVLDAFNRAAPNLAVSIIDVGSADGPRRLDAVLERVMERSRAEVEAQKREIVGIIGQYPGLSADLERLSGVLLRADGLVSESAVNAAALKRFLSDAAAMCRLSAQDLGKAGSQTEGALTQTIGRSPVPALDAAAASVREPVRALVERLGEIGRSLEATVAARDEQIAAAVKEALRPAVEIAGSLRRSAGGLLEKTDGLGTLPVVTVARVVEQTSAAMVIGPPKAEGESGRSLAAIDIDSLYPAASAGGTEGGEGGATIDLRARTEDLLGSALQSLVDSAPPIVVLTHIEPNRFGPGFDRFSALVTRLRLRGIDIAEWAVALEESPPSLKKLDPTGKRPVVYVVLYTTPDTVEGATRLVRMSRAVTELFVTGKPMLMSITPSTLPALGQTDPMTEFLGASGLEVDSGRPLLRQIGTPASPLVASDVFVSAGDEAHPIAAAIRGLRTRLPWALPIRLKDGAAGLSPLLTAEADGRTWAESQWREFASVPAASRAMVRPQDQPKPDSSRDDAKGPWVVAAALTREGGQRTVIVGSNTWFRDDIADAVELVGNRVRLLNPGNSELFEASVYWLSGREEVMGASPQASAVSIIPNDLSQGAISAIRWALIAGLPLLILLTGAVWRVARG